MTAHAKLRAAGRGGFTLIEVMVVIVIIGLLAAMVVPNLFGIIGRAEVTRAKGDIRSIETALNVFRLDNFLYPTTEEGFEALVTNPGEAAARNWQPYLSSLPSDPWSNTYLYLYPGEQREFDVFSYGADGQEGGEDLNADIGNWNLD